MLIISCENYIFFDINADKDNFIVYLTSDDYDKTNFITVCLPAFFLFSSYEATAALENLINRGVDDT